MGDYPLVLGFDRDGGTPNKTACSMSHGRNSVKGKYRGIIIEGLIAEATRLAIRSIGHGSYADPNRDPSIARPLPVCLKAPQTCRNFRVPSFQLPSHYPKEDINELLS